MIEQWHEFFVMVGGGAAVLAGLVFIAMAENVKAIVQDATHRYRAIGTLAGFTSAFVICGLALMADQNLLALGIEWLVVSGIAGSIYFYGFFQAKNEGGSPTALSFTRAITGGALYVVQMIGSIFLMLNNIVGLYIAAIALIISLAYMISGAWLLIVGVNQNELNK